MSLHADIVMQLLKDLDIDGINQKLVNFHSGISEVSCPDGKRIIINHYGGMVHTDNEMPAILLLNSRNHVIERYYCKFGKLHRDDDEPAVITPNYRFWYKFGLEHRDGDYPSYISDELYEYKKFGVLHRFGGPAWTGLDGEYNYLYGINVE